MTHILQENRSIYFLASILSVADPHPHLQTAYPGSGRSDGSSGGPCRSMWRYIYIYIYIYMYSLFCLCCMCMLCYVQSTVTLNIPWGSIKYSSIQNIQNKLTYNKGMDTFPRKSALRSRSSSRTVTSRTAWMSFTLLAARTEQRSYFRMMFKLLNVCDKCKYRSIRCYNLLVVLCYLGLAIVVCLLL